MNPKKDSTKPPEVSGITFLDAGVYSLEEVRELFPHLSSLIAYMEAYDLEKVVKARTGNWAHFNKRDKVAITIDIK